MITPDLTDQISKLNIQKTETHIDKTSEIRPIDRRLSVAPMLDWTDRHCRFLLRLISPNALLYTEMVTTGALIHGDRQRFLGHHDIEHPLAIQFGGADPTALAQCAQIAERAGFDEVNLNVGCPSDRVQSGEFGACLMKTPSRVADCIRAMREAVSIPVTIKHRIGVDKHDSYDELIDFIGTQIEHGCDIFIVHARKAWLKGLSPKENREIPELRHDWVARLVTVFPQAQFIVNGGINDLATALPLLDKTHGVMIGREAYHNPQFLRELDHRIFATPLSVDDDTLISELVGYAANNLKAGVPLRAMVRHWLGLFHGQAGAKQWRRMLSDAKLLKASDETLIYRAFEQVRGSRVSEAQVPEPGESRIDSRTAAE